LNSEIRWFRAVARRGAEGYFGGPNDLDPQRKQIFDAIELPLLKALRRIKPVRKGDLQAYFDLIPFTRQLSPFNVWLMYVMMTFPNVSYRQGRLASTTTLANGKVKVAFKDGASDTFDRVVTRYGPGRGKPLIHPTTATEPSGYLLVSPEGLVSRGVTGQYVDLASDAIGEARKRLTKRRSSRAIGHYIEKSLYVPMIEAPRRLLPNGESRAPYDQAALVQMIKDGVRPRFSQFRPW
jgi:hypothetical protein